MLLLLLLLLEPVILKQRLLTSRMNFDDSA
jgi:hypothetical protein